MSILSILSILITIYIYIFKISQIQLFLLLLLHSINNSKYLYLMRDVIFILLRWPNFNPKHISQRQSFYAEMNLMFTSVKVIISYLIIVVCVTFNCWCHMIISKQRSYLKCLSLSATYQRNRRLNHQSQNTIKENCNSQLHSSSIHTSLLWFFCTHYVDA